MSVQRQLIIHQVAKEAGLPLELSDEIMSFCFYDTITAAYRAVHKVNFGEIIEHFDDAYISRARPFGCLFNDPDNSEHWAICLSRVNHLYIDNETQFQAYNCRVCGDYYFCCTFLPEQQTTLGQGLDHLFREAIPLRIRCQCDR